MGHQSSPEICSLTYLNSVSTGNKLCCFDQFPHRKLEVWGVSTNVKIIHSKRKRKTKIKPDQTMYDQFEY